MQRRFLKIFLVSALGLVLLVPVGLGLLTLGLPLIAVVGLLAIPAIALLAIVGIPLMAVLIVFGAAAGIVFGAIGVVFGLGFAILRVALTLLIIAGLCWIVFKLVARREEHLA